MASADENPPQKAEGEFFYYWEQIDPPPPLVGTVGGRRRGASVRAVGLRPNTVYRVWTYRPRHWQQVLGQEVDFFRNNDVFGYVDVRTGPAVVLTKTLSGSLA